jgi:hypothetical protein
MAPSFSYSTPSALSFHSLENILGGLSLSDVDQSIARRDGTFFDKNSGALAKGVLIANAAGAAWRTLVLLLTWCVAFSLFLVINHILNSIKLRLGLWIFSGHGCVGLCGPRSHREEEVGRTTSIRSKKSESDLAAAMGTNGVDSLPWSWK